MSKEMNIGIVTSFYNGYGKFLLQWAESISKLHTPPKMVTVVASGENHGLTKDMEIQVKKLIPNIKIYYLPEHKGMGYARNKAVEYTETEWIQYLDADDIILPEAVDIYKKYANKTDVICGGLDIRGCKNRKSLYLHASRQRQLQGKHCTSSHGVYKRKFWELCPYVNNDYCEQILWLGFAQKGAEFMGTKEFCTVYLSRAAGHNMNMTEEHWDAVKEQRELFVKEGVNHDKAILFQSTDGHR